MAAPCPQARLLSRRALGSAARNPSLQAPSRLPLQRPRRGLQPPPSCSVRGPTQVPSLGVRPACALPPPKCHSSRPATRLLQGRRPHIRLAGDAVGSHCTADPNPPPVRRPLSARERAKPRPPAPDASLRTQPDSWGLAHALAPLCTGADTTARRPSILPAHTQHPTHSIPAHLSPAARRSLLLCRLLPTACTARPRPHLPSALRGGMEPKGGLSSRRVSECRQERRGAPAASSSWTRLGDGAPGRDDELAVPTPPPTAAAPPGLGRCPFPRWDVWALGLRPSAWVGPALRRLRRSLREVGRAPCLHSTQHVSPAPVRGVRGGGEGRVPESTPIEVQGLHTRVA